MRKLTKNYTYLEILVTYLNNTSEETILVSNEMGNNVTSKWRSYADKYLKPWLMNWPD